MKKYNRIFITASSLLLASLSLATFLSPDNRFSENENRFLAEKPALSLESVINGHFEKQAEKYLSDHIFCRENFVAVKSITESALGIRDINGTYLCRDGRLVQRITDREFNQEKYENNLRQIKELRQTLKSKGISLTLMPVPTAQYIYRSRLPAHALRFDEDRAFSMARAAVQDSLVDLRPVLEHYAENETRRVFFTTDHHWTGYGAFLAYGQYLGALGYDVSEQAFNPELLSDDFRGTLYSRVLLPRTEPDVIECPSGTDKMKCTVTISGKTYDSLYDRQYLKKKDKYAVYFGGNFDVVDIKNKQASSKEKLLIVKDSFANSFVPHIVKDFSQITMVDPRYCRDNITKLAESFDRVLILYNMAGLAEENLHLNQTLLQ